MFLWSSQNEVPQKYPASDLEAFSETVEFNFLFGNGFFFFLSFRKGLIDLQTQTLHFLSD